MNMLHCLDHLASNNSGPGDVTSMVELEKVPVLQIKVNPKS